MSEPAPRPLGELLGTAGLEVPTGLDQTALRAPVSLVVCDSRKAIPGCLFVALPGHTTAGHLYVEDAVKRGCGAVLLERGLARPEWGVSCIEVENAQKALIALAGAWYGYPARQLTCIGVTGTNGKTTTTWLVEGMLLHAGLYPGVLGTINYRYHDAEGEHVLANSSLTTPDILTLQAMLRKMVDAGVTHLVMELSSHALDQGRVDGMEFKVAVFTNLTRDHLDYHKDMAGYFAAKQLLFTRYLAPQGAAVIDIDAPGDEEPWGERLAAAVGADRRVLRTGMDARCEIRALSVSCGFDGFACRLSALDEEIALHSPLVGGYNVRNVLGAVGVGLALDLSLAQVCAGIASVDAVPGRLERVLPPGVGKKMDAVLFPAVFVDYAHTPDALDNVLRTLRGVQHSGRLACVFGCGGDRDPGKRPMMGEVAAKGADIIFVTSDNPRTEEPESIIDAIVPGLLAAGARQCEAEDLFAADCGDGVRFARMADRAQAIRLACALAAPQDIVLIAGKGHEDYQIQGRNKKYFDDRIVALDALVAWNRVRLVRASGGHIVNRSRPRLLGAIRTDSRALTPGDIFLALKGERFDGHDYIEQALAKGAGAVIAERFPEAALNRALCLKVEDSLASLGALAHFRRELFAGRLKVAAITGSSGKTTVKEMLAAICEQALKDDWANARPVLKTSGNFNNLIGLPLSLLPLGAGQRIAILEMGMSAPGEIAALSRIADPDIGCVSTVHPAHLQGLGSIEGVAAAKGELFHSMRPDALRVVNEDDPRIWKIAEKAGGRKIGFAVTAAGMARNPQVFVTDIENQGADGLCFILHIGSWWKSVHLPVLGEHNAHNACVAAALAFGLGIAPERIAYGLARYQPVEGRLAVKELPGGIKLLNDVYNANPASMAAGLRTLSALANARKGQRSGAVLGDMLELGPDSPALHRGIGELAAELRLDWLAVTGEMGREIAAGAITKGLPADRVRHFSVPAEIAAWCAGLARDGQLASGDWVLVKGSRGMHMECFIDELERQLSGDAHAL